jgi:tetratricopeptide (TPR) repeat protein
MKTRYATFYLVFSIVILSATHVQDRGGEQTIVQAKRLLARAVNEAKRDLFVQAKTMLEPLANNENNGSLAHYYLGYIGYQMGVVVERMDKERAVAYLDTAVEHLEAAIQKDERLAEAYALLSSCYGIKISFSPLKGIILGPKSGSLMGKAKSLAPENPRVALLDAIGTYNTPAIFGGGKDKGFAGFKKAAELFDRWKDADSLQPSWGREEVYAWVGIAHLDRNEPIMARRAFEKALEINPDYGWVKWVLMPRVAAQEGKKE